MPTTRVGGHRADRQTHHIHVSINDAMPFALSAAKLPGTAHFYEPGPDARAHLRRGARPLPGAKFVMTEVDVGWVPYFADRPTTTTCVTPSRLQGQPLPQLPGDYIRESFYFTFITDMYGIQNRDRIGYTHMLWSNDYPHITSDWPNRGRRSTPSSAACPTRSATPCSPATPSTSTSSGGKAPRGDRP